MEKLISFFVFLILFSFNKGFCAHSEEGQLYSVSCSAQPVVPGNFQFVEEYLLTLYNREEELVRKIDVSCDWDQVAPARRIVSLSNHEDIFGVAPDNAVKYFFQRIYEEHREIPEVNFLFFEIRSVYPYSPAYAQLARLGFSANWVLNPDEKGYAIKPGESIPDGEGCFTLYAHKDAFKESTDSLSNDFVSWKKEIE